MAEAQQQRYELVSTLGRGGMAEVFLGWMNSVGGIRRRVAIKRILPDLAQKQAAMFERMFVDEARLAFQLEHDNIVRVYDVGQSGKTFFIVMEYVEGMDLKRVYEETVERGEMLSIADVLYITAQVASGLFYAHSLTDDDGDLLGLVHNDISPPNVLVGRYGEVKVADFGLADATSNLVETPDGMVKGKFAYISPESTRDPSLISPVSDIFSVGIVAWELMAGQRLFQKETDLATFQAVRDCIVPDIRDVRPEVPEAVAQILNKTLAADPVDRYQSCEHLYNDIAKVSHECNIPLSRLYLRRLVGHLKGEQWGFEGEELDDDAAANIVEGLDDMLPPGVSDHLKSFVTGASEADDSDFMGAEVVDDGWMDDVFDDVGGFDDFDVENAMSHASLPAVAKKEPEKPPELEKAAPPPVEKKTSPPPVSKKTSKPAVKAAEPSNQAEIEELLKKKEATLMAAMEVEVKKMRGTFIVYGAIGGLVIGAVLGAVIGMMM